MRKLYAFSILLCLLATTISLKAQTVSYTGPAVAVPDNNAAGVNIVLPVAGVGTIADLNFRFDIGPGACDATPVNTNAAMDHTFVGDIIFRLTSPGGTTVIIMNRRGGTRENICATLLDDDGGFPALSTITSVSGSTVSGNFAPENPLSAFDGQNANGNWTLNVSDNAGIDNGSMRRFSLIFSAAASLCGPTAPQVFTNNTPVSIVDNTVVSSTIAVAGAPTTLYNLKMFTNITHTFGGDMDITLTSPAGTVVTVSSDNSGGSDNTFAGTLWDDDANPSGVNPYTSNNGMVTDNLYTNLVAAATLTPEEPFAAFIGENPNGIWTIRISDDAGGDAGALNNWSLTISGLAATPPTLTPTSASNNTPVGIPDNTGSVTSTINIAGAGTQIFDVNATLNITHTFTGDVQVTLTSPAGTVVTLSSNNGGGNDNVFAGTTFNDNADPANQVPFTGNTFAASNLVTDRAYTNLVTATPLVPEEPLGAFIGENPNGIWTLRVSDNGAGDAGTLNSWSLDITTSTCPCISPTIITHPANAASVCVGGSTSFNVATGGTPPTYQWQVNTGSGFTNLANGAPYSNVNTATLTVNPIAAIMDGYLYRCIVTNNCGTLTSNAATLTINTITHSAVSATPVVSCSPGSTVITGTASSGVGAGGNAIMGSSGPINLAIPDNSAGGVNSTIALSGANFPTAADLKLRLNMRHSWVGDLRITLTSPCGTTLVFDRPGVPASGAGNSNNLGTSNITTPPPAVYLFDIAGATIIPETALASGFIPAGTYQPSDASNPGFAHNWAGLTFPCGAGNWVLNISDNFGGDVGVLVDWAILKTNIYTHALTGGPGTITQNPATGPNNSTGNFTVTAIPAGNHTYTLTSTDARGCTVSTNLSVVVNPTPAITIAPAAPVICNGDIQQLTATVVPPVTQLVTGGSTVTIGTTAGPANPYPSNLVVTGLPTTGVTIKSVTLNGVSHTFPSDLDILLQSPTGGNVILLSDRGGATPISNINLTFDDAAAAIAPSPLVAGTHRPTNTAGPDNFPAPGPGSVNQVNPTLASLGSTTDYNGAWKLFVNDQFNLDGGSITDWSITFNIPVPVIWTGGAGTIFTNPAATTPYIAGTPTLLPVYVKPTATTTATSTIYTATATRAGCTGTANVTVTTNALPAITTQPSPATQTICPGFNVIYSVAATGTGVTFQWRKNGVALVNGVQASGSLVSGATTNSVTLIGVVAADAGTYTVAVSGTCPPTVISSNAVLVIASAPVIATQPANRTVCEGLPAAFTVAATGSPTPTIYQWQVSTNGGGLWTNLTTGGSFTPTFTIPATTIAQNGNLYRVIVTNSCGQTTTSSNATLTVNAATVLSVVPLPARICLSNSGTIPLVGTPAGGTWSGIGVSGSNFVPSVTSVGTYRLTYTFTNASGCVSTATVTANVVANAECDQIRLLSDDALILYPNPNDGRFNIRINSTLYSFLGMQVYSSSGQLVHTQLFRQLVYGQVLPIDLTKLPSGPYMVKFYYDGGARTSEKTFPVIIGRQ